MPEVSEETQPNAASAFVCSHIAVCSNTVCMMVSVIVDFRRGT